MDLRTEFRVFEQDVTESFAVIDGPVVGSLSVSPIRCDRPALQSALVDSVRPNGIDKCRLECWTIAPDWGDGEGPDYWTVNNGERLCDILLEDTEFGTQIQRSMESPGFKGVPLSYQEARIYHWNQNADRMIGLDKIPTELAVQQVIPEDWVYPNDPRVNALQQ